MKRRELERALRALGWWLHRHGANHDVWTNGQQEETLPRHADVHELLATKILRKAGEKR